MGKSPVFRHHWLAYWQSLTVVAWLVVLGLLLGIALGPWPGVVLGSIALSIAVRDYLLWRWQTFTFTPDNRLIRRRGVLGLTEDMISLFGVITPYRIPLLSSLLDVGSVHLGVPGPDIHIKYIADFTAFHQRLMHGARRRDLPSPPSPSLPPPSVHIWIQLLPLLRIPRDHLSRRTPDSRYSIPSENRREEEEERERAERSR